MKPFWTVAFTVRKSRPIPKAHGTLFLSFSCRNRFGEPSPQVVAILNGLSEVSQLEELLVRLLHVSSWEESLGLNGQG